MATRTAEIQVPAGMDATWLDRAIARTFEKDLKVVSTNRPGVYVMHSTSQPGVTYVVTANCCACKGQQEVGRCMHRARAAFEDLVVADAAAAAGELAPCRKCRGRGWFLLPSFEATVPPTRRTCDRCHGLGQAARKVA